ncbi:putative phosphoglycerate mutase GpmB [Thermocladium modestius]|uniref:Putative phosphoglycerate mutase GpmB n=1 Tax=Thermocladium modestius TaxID=62609 RepID=A0A830GVX5_9CREN|nr:histidine phosphatase family protein [Thermocladium modestius]GGP21844.1 putative phosphoglycerate mutase GpmB [Thermocladium modestius]
MIFLVRHGESTFNVMGILHSSTIDEGPLSDKGREEAAAAARFLKRLGFNGRVYSSPLRRARETASFFTDDFVIDDRLREVGMGAWEKKRITDIPEFHLYSQDPVRNPPPGGESIVSVLDRVTSILNEVEDGSVLVSHWLPIAVAIAAALGMPLNNIYRMRIGNASISALSKKDGGWVVEFINIRPRDMELIVGGSIQ